MKGFYIYSCPKCLIQSTTTSKSINHIPSPQTHLTGTNTRGTVYNIQTPHTSTTTTETIEDEHFQVDYNDDGLDDAIQSIDESPHNNQTNEQPTRKQPTTPPHAPTFRQINNLNETGEQIAAELALLTSIHESQIHSPTSEYQDNNTEPQPSTLADHFLQQAAILASYNNPIPTKALNFPQETASSSHQQSTYRPQQQTS
jgi:hypothetical protein